MKEEMKQGLQDLYNMRPIDYAVNMLTVIIMTGFVLALPIAALLRRDEVASEKVRTEE